MESAREREIKTWQQMQMCDNQNLNYWDEILIRVLIRDLETYVWFFMSPSIAPLYFKTEPYANFNVSNVISRIAISKLRENDILDTATKAARHVIADLRDCTKLTAEMPINVKEIFDTVKNIATDHEAQSLHLDPTKLLDCIVKGVQWTLNYKERRSVHGRLEVIITDVSKATTGFPRLRGPPPIARPSPVTVKAVKNPGQQKTVTCWGCGKVGHLVVDCTKQPTDCRTCGETHHTSHHDNFGKAAASRAITPMRRSSHPKSPAVRRPGAQKMTKTTAYSVDSNEGDSDNDLHMANLTLPYGNSATHDHDREADLVTALDDSMFEDDSVHGDAEEISANASMTAFASRSSETFRTPVRAAASSSRDRRPNWPLHLEDEDEITTASSSIHIELGDISDPEEEKDFSTPQPEDMPLHLVHDQEVHEFVNQERSLPLLINVAQLRLSMTEVDPERVTRACNDIRYFLGLYPFIFDTPPDVLLMWRLTGVRPDLNVNSMMDFDPEPFNIMSRYPEPLRRVGEPTQQVQPQPAEQEPEPHVEDEQPIEPLPDAEVSALAIHHAQPATIRDADLPPAIVVIRTDVICTLDLCSYTSSVTNRRDIRPSGEMERRAIAEMSIIMDTGSTQSLHDILNSRVEILRPINDMTKCHAWQRVTSPPTWDVCGAFLQARDGGEDHSTQEPDCSRCEPQPVNDTPTTRVGSHVSLDAQSFDSDEYEMHM
jgi:hypothetical protein